MATMDFFTTTLADAYLHDFNSVILRIWGPAAIRWYGLAYLLGFLLSWYALKRMAKSKKLNMAPEAVGDFILYAVAGVVIGGRLGFVFFYDLTRSFEEGVTPLLWDFTDSFPFWGALRLTDGGMSFHGGLIGAAVAIVTFAKLKKISFLNLMDASALVVPFGLGLGRVANFINGELWGKPLDANMQANPPWWSIKYPEEVKTWAPEQLRDLAPAANEIGLSPETWVSLTELMRVDESAAGTIYQKIDEMITALKGGNETVYNVFASLSDSLVAYYPSQLIQAVAEGIVLFAVLALIWLKPRTTGVISAWFLLTYGVLRIITEKFRQADEGVALILGMQRGQLLSVLMILTGIILLVFVMRKKVEKPLAPTSSGG